MNILGISGLPTSEAFKRERFNNLSNREYRIIQGLDSAAAIIIDGKIIAAAAEERFSRKKGTGDFPKKAIEFCLKAANIKFEDLDYISHGFCYEPLKQYYDLDPLAQFRFQKVYCQEVLIRHFKDIFQIDVSQKLIRVPHHLAHAASAFYLSGLEESLIIVADGMGEMESLSIAVGKNQEIKILKQISEAHSLGIFYSIFTLYLGFEFNMDECKVMGLAPYGNPKRYFHEIMEMVHLQEEGTFTIPLLSKNITLVDKETYAGSLSILAEKFGEPRISESQITQRERDLAAGLQAVLQTSLMHVLRYFKHKTGQNSLCMAGGVALNCSLNAYIKKSRLFNSLFIQPAAGDDGSALGSALYVYRSQNPGRAFPKLTMPFYGPEFSQGIIESALDPSLYNIQKFPNFNDMSLEIAKKIASGEIVALFQGKMELGPRALGNRSILADPRNKEMQEKINRLIKNREDFRPFAPAVIAERACEFFNIEEQDIIDYQYMLMTATVKDVYKSHLPAVTHVDGSARVQTVYQMHCPNFWQIINEFGRLTGIPVLLNTSFNVRGQPIVCTPAEALQTFLVANLDVLAIDNYLVSRKKRD